MTTQRRVTDLDTGHEEVVVGQDPETGLHAIIAVYSTALGPALGGTRFRPYASEDEALADVLSLSRAMAYKNALAGLDHGGGKAVIIGDPNVDKTPDLLRAYGRLVESLEGRYITACDIGTYVADMDVVAETSSHVTGRSEAQGGAGDSSVLTAYGVYLGMRAAAEHDWGSPSLTGRRVGIEGIGKVGRHLLDHLTEEGAEVVVTDISPEARQWATDHHGGVKVTDDTDELRQADLDIYAPCALGGTLNDVTVDTISARIVCGAANNQLAHRGIDEALADRDVLYCPDFLVNAGGVIQVADELHGFDFERARHRTQAIGDTLREVLALAAAEGITPSGAADRMAEARMAATGRRG